MATELTVVDLPSAYEAAIANTPVDVGLVASDLAGNTFRSTGREIVIAQNDDVGAVTVTVSSQPASRTGRVGDIAAASIPASGVRMFQIFPRDGWESGGLITITTSDVDCLLAVVRAPLQAAG